MPNRLRFIRNLRRKTQVELALETGLSQTAISNFENGLTEPSEEEKEKLSGALGVGINDIFGPADVVEVRLVAAQRMDDR
jgi:transcriptional regulator with XRE-family HTH domain